MQESASGNPVTATVEIAERNPSGTKGSKIAVQDHEKVEVPESKGPSVSHPEGGAAIAGAGPGDAVTGIAPVGPEGKPQGDSLPAAKSSASCARVTRSTRKGGRPRCSICPR